MIYQPVVQHRLPKPWRLRRCYSPSPGSNGPRLAGHASRCSPAMQGQHTHAAVTTFSGLILLKPLHPGCQFLFRYTSSSSLNRNLFRQLHTSSITVARQCQESVYSIDFELSLPGRLVASSGVAVVVDSRANSSRPTSAALPDTHKA